MNEIIDRNEIAKKAILDSLNDQQKCPVINYHGASFTYAAPGSGKTKMMVSRAQYMILDGVDPSNILMFTFTKKAANEMLERVKKQVGEMASAITIRTYHSFCGLMLRRYADYLEGFTHNFSIFDTEDKRSILKDIAKKKTIDFKDLEQCISHWKDHLVSPEAAVRDVLDADFSDYSNPQEQQEIYMIMANAYKEYQDKMKSLNAMDFDDLLYYYIYILENFEAVRKQMHHKYHYIMNDESQDSNPTNLRLIELLANPDFFNVCCVGDVDQSIYGWRGSDIEAVSRFIENHNMTIYELSRNYRSTQTIFAAARSVIRNNGTPFKEEPFSKNEKGNKVVFLEFNTAAQEAAMVAKAILMFMSDKNKNIPLSEMAILYRTSYQSRALEDAFLRRGVPYTITGGTPFYSRKEIKDILSYIRFANNPSDEMAFERAIQTPKRGIGEANMVKILSCINDIIKGDSVTSCIDNQDSAIIRVLNGLKERMNNLEVKGKAKAGLTDFINTMIGLAYIIDQDKPQEMIKYLVSNLNYGEYLKQYCEKNSKEKTESDAEERMENINELIEIAATFSSIDEFLQGMMLTSELSDMNEDVNVNEKVSLMTMHSAKGLEYDVVFIVGASEGTCPHSRSKTLDDIREERNLFYVSMTRARKELFIFRHKISVIGGLSMSTETSRFVKEIDEQYLKTVPEKK